MPAGTERPRAAGWTIFSTALGEVVELRILQEYGRCGGLLRHSAAPFS